MYIAGDYMIVRTWDCLFMIVYKLKVASLIFKLIKGALGAGLHSKYEAFSIEYAICNTPTGF